MSSDNLLNVTLTRGYTPVSATSWSMSAIPTLSTINPYLVTFCLGTETVFIQATPVMLSSLLCRQVRQGPGMYRCHQGRLAA